MNKRIALGIVIFLLIPLIFVNIFPIYAKHKMEEMHYNRFVEGNDTYKGAEYCKTCHEEHYEQWRTSLHSTADTEEIFVDRIDDMKDMLSPETCYDCHGIKDSKEGVSCEICHGPGETKIGSNKNPEFRIAEPCIRCHEATNPVTKHELMTPYKEWLTSKAKREGKTCVTCHMPEVTANNKTMHFHGFHGARAHPESYNGTVEITDIRLKDGEVIVTVKNLVEGHYMPTGAPERGLALEIVVYDDQGKVLQKEEYMFQRDCIVMKNMPMLVKSDTRLKDGEERELSFKLKGKSTTVKAALRFKTSTWAQPDGVDIVVDEEELRVG